MDTHPAVLHCCPPPATWQRMAVHIAGMAAHIEGMAAAELSCPPERFAFGGSCKTTQRGGTIWLTNTHAEPRLACTRCVRTPRQQPSFLPCRYGYASVDNLTDVVSRYQSAGIPLEAIWSDIDYSEGTACTRCICRMPATPPAL